MPTNAFQSDPAAPPRTRWRARAGRGLRGGLPSGGAARRTCSGSGSPCSSSLSASRSRPRCPISHVQPEIRASASANAASALFASTRSPPAVGDESDGAVARAQVLVDLPVRGAELEFADQRMPVVSHRLSVGSAVPPSLQVVCLTAALTADSETVFDPLVFSALFLHFVENWYTVVLR